MSLPEGVDQRGHDDLFQFGPAEAVAALGEIIDIKLLELPTALSQMDADDVFAFVEVGKIDEEQFIEATATQHFRRQVLDRVRGGDGEDGLLNLGHPRQERSHETEHRWIRTTSRVTFHAREALLHFVEPQDRRRDRLDEMQHAAQISLGFTALVAEQRADVEPNQGEAE